MDSTYYTNPNFHLPKKEISQIYPSPTPESLLQETIMAQQQDYSIENLMADTEMLFRQREKDWASTYPCMKFDSFPSLQSSNSYPSLFDTWVEGTISPSELSPVERALDVAPIIKSEFPKSESPSPSEISCDSISPTLSTTSLSSVISTYTDDSISPPPPKKKKTEKKSTYNRWSEEEDAKLISAIKVHGTKGNWRRVSMHVPGRSAIQCSSRWQGALNPKITKGKWRVEEDEILLDTYNVYVNTGLTQSALWNKVASALKGRTSVQCNARFNEALDPNVRKGKWTKCEDELLKKGIDAHGSSWVKVAEFVNGRTQRQCRTRWVQIKKCLTREK